MQVDGSIHLALMILALLEFSVLSLVVNSFSFLMAKEILLSLPSKKKEINYVNKVCATVCQLGTYVPGKGVETNVYNCHLVINGTIVDTFSLCSTCYKMHEVIKKLIVQEHADDVLNMV